MATEDPIFTGNSSSEDTSDGAEDTAIYRLFRDRNNRSYKFFLHKSVKKDDQRRVLEKDIGKHGGRIALSEFKTDFVLVHPLYQNKDVLQTSYNADDDPRLHKVYVEYATFIRRCIRDKDVLITQKIRGMGGRPPGGLRNEFTYEDDTRLCHYLAKLMPDKEAGGRQGINVYQRLVQMAKDIPERYKWGSRHTAESWKERYKKHQAQFDPRIKAIVKKSPPMKKQLWHEDRRASQTKQKVTRSVVELDSDGEELEPEEDDEEEEHITDEDNIKSPRKRRRSERQSQSIEPAAKRPRRSSHRQQEISASGKSGHRKGRQSALEPEDEEEEEEEEYPEMYTLPEEFEPGPSGYLRSPERTLVASAPTQEPSFSQQTLRNTPPLGVVSNAPSAKARNTGRRSQQSTGKIVHSSPPPPSSFGSSENDKFFLNMNSPIVIPESSQPRLSSGTLARNLAASPGQMPSPIPPSPPQASSQWPNRAARRPPVVTRPVANDSAPYRNTRSRSHSVETTALPPPKRPRRVKETIPEEDPEVVEFSDGEGITQPSGESPPNGETAVEEVIVENMLIAQVTEDSNTAQDVRGEASMETDDAQVALSLRPPAPAPSQIRPRQGFSSLTVRPTDMLRQFENSAIRFPTQARPSSMRRSDVNSRPPPHRVERVEQSRAQRESLPFNFTVPNWDPHTPAQRTRKTSTSSLESFPASGTRASALKKSRQLQEKETPYKPPDGTRAAMFVKLR